ncbi:MAG: hypothetical protein IH611_13515, partial [Deltaproteobacteria bacterium]|nr:hypothetical protein [Deltaproteobacteria bacterium]
MRFTSSRRSAVAILLCVVLPLQWSALPPAEGEAGEGPESALLLKYVAPDIPEEASRKVLDPLPGKVARDVRVTWV